MKLYTFGAWLICNLIFVACFSQTNKFVRVQGTVIDKSTLEPIPGVNIFLRKSSIGTFSNELGEFELMIPDSLMRDTLALSSIGYKTYQERISNLDLINPTIYYLEQDKIVLQEVVISAKSEKGRILASKALSKLSKTKSIKQHVAHGFYRELSMKDSTYIRLIESAVEVQDFGYGSSLDKMKIKILALRKSEDYITYSWMDKTAKLFFGEDNMLYKTIQADFLRNYKSNQKLAPVDKLPFLDEYYFTIEDYTMFDSDSLVILKFNSDETNPRPYYEGRLFINLSDFGIVRMEYGMVANPTMKIRMQDDVFYQGKFLFKTTVDYRKVNGKYFLSRVVLIKPQNFAAVESGKGTGQQFTVFDFSINNILTNKSDFERIKRKESQQKDVDLYNQNFQYDPDFWETYNIVKLNPLLKKAKADLEKEEQLEDQFKRKGN